MLDQQATSSLQYEENRLLHEEQMNELRQAMLRLARVNILSINMPTLSTQFLINIKASKY
jgi:hypothetical protein